MMDYPAICRIDSPLIVDTHSHYDDERFDDIRDELFAAMRQNGVDKIITCGCDKASSLKALEIAERYDFVYAAVGIHPESIDNGTTIQDIRELATHKKCVAIGEIGLDYYWSPDKKVQQTEICKQQLLLANELNLPVIVHDREAHEDTAKLLLEHKPRGVLHCFSGSAETARQLTAIGMYIGVGGVVTFKNAKKLPDVVASIPEERLLLETDCPYLAPEPFRGKLCHSGMITLTAKKIAEIRNDDYLSILAKSKANAEKLFAL